MLARPLIYLFIPKQCTEILSSQQAALSNENAACVIEQSKGISVYIELLRNYLKTDKRTYRRYQMSMQASLMRAR
jgi:hypothetical protein